MPKRASPPTADRRCRGSILIDAMLGTVVIGIVVIALFLALSLANRIALRAKHVAVAKGVAETEIEIARSTDYDSLAVGTTAGSVTTLPTGSKSMTIAYYDADGSGTADANDKVKLVSVTVSWRERQGTESLTLTTLSTKGGTGI